MTDAPQWGESLALDFKGHTIRAVPIDGVLWFLLEDLADALGFSPDTVEAVNRRHFPSFARLEAEEAPEEGEGPRNAVTLVSPVGVWFWVAIVNPKRGEGLAAWAKREALRHCPDAAPDNRAVYLSLLDDWELPAFYPTKYSGRRAEFLALKESRLWSIYGPGGLVETSGSKAPAAT